jgi:uncharacterized protein YndB with AHSA1/START domain
VSDDHCLQKQIMLNAAPERAWEAIATRQGITAWFGPQEEETTAAGTCILGDVTAWVPGRRLTARGPAAADGSSDSFQFDLEPDGSGGTLLRFSHNGFRGDNWKDMYDITSTGWDMYLQTLSQYLTHFPDRTAAFIGAEGPPASAREDAWDVFLAGCGLSSQSREGDQVLIEVEGLPPVEGIVDYLHPAGADARPGPDLPAFLGVRTPDALCRFHGRAALGATLAVGHHVFGRGPDIDHAQRAWKAWLDNLYGVSAGASRS